MKESLFIPIDKRVSLPGGYLAETQVAPPEWHGKSVSNTSVHEAVHGGLALLKDEHAVQKISRVPGPGYKGITITNYFIPESAIGPASLHMEGTQYDEALCEHMHVNIGAKSAEARSKVSRFKENFMALAYAVDRKGTLYDAEAREAFQSPDQPNAVTTKLTAPDGSYVLFEGQAENGLVKLSGDIFPLVA